MGIKIIQLDLDGTLLTSDKRISRANYEALERAAAQGVMFFVVRALSAVWGLVFVYIYGENGEGFTIAAVLMMLLLIVSLLIGLIGAPRTKGKSLEEITRERYGDDI